MLASITLITPPLTHAKGLQHDAAHAPPRRVACRRVQQIS